MCVVNYWNPIDQLNPTNDETPSLYSFPYGSNFEIGQNFMWLNLTSHCMWLNVLMMISSGDCGLLRYQYHSSFPSERISTLILAA